MADPSNTPVDPRNMSFLELLSEPNTWRLLSIPFCGMILMTTWFAIATYLDVRNLNVDAATIKAETSAMQAAISEVKENQSQMKTEMSSMKTEISEIKVNQTQMKTEMSHMRSDINELTGTVNELIGIVKEQNGKMDIIIRFLNLNGNNQNSHFSENETTK